MDNFRKRRVIVQMELPIEPHRLNAQRIPIRVSAFEKDYAALVAPERRDHDGQFHIGLPRKFLQFRLILPDDACLAHHENAHNRIIAALV